MGFSLIELEEYRGVLEGHIHNYNSLETCVVESPSKDASVFGDDPNGYRLPGNGRDVLVLTRNPIKIIYQSKPGEQEQLIGTIVWKGSPNLIP